MTIQNINIQKSPKYVAYSIIQCSSKTVIQSQMTLILVLVFLLNSFYQINYKYIKINLLIDHLIKPEYSIL